MLGLLLEGVQYINPSADLDRVDRPVSILVEPQSDLKHPAADAPERLGGRRLISLLRIVERDPDTLSYR